MNAHEEDLARAEAYALGALEDAERSAYEAHLGGCPTCRTAVSEASVVLSGLALAAEPVAPPEGAGKRLMARFRAEIVPPAPPASPSGGGGSIVMALVAAGALAFGGWTWTELRDQKLRASSAEQERDTLKGDVEHCQTERRHEAAAKATLDTVTSILNAPDVKAFGSTKNWRKDYEGTAQAVWSPSLRKVAIMGAGLAKLPEGKVYKLWQVADSGIVPMRVLGAEPFVIDNVAQPGKAFAISIEDAAGAETIKAPKDPVLLLG